METSRWLEFHSKISTDERVNVGNATQKNRNITETKQNKNIKTTREWKNV